MGGDKEKIICNNNKIIIIQMTPLHLIAPCTRIFCRTCETKTRHDNICLGAVEQKMRSRGSKIHILGEVKKAFRNKKPHHDPKNPSDKK